jgi:tripartite-type tricarboxylate transporter receptor subunit TctC
MTHRRTLLLAPLALAAPRVLHAQENWPNRPIRVVNPWTPGGPADLVARPILAKMSEALGQPMVLENRPGANGTIGAEHVARAAPDGYTLLFSQAGPNALAPATNPRLPYDPIRDFSPITRLVSAPLVLFVRSDSPIRSVPDLIAAARARPGALSYGSVGPGSTTHLAAEMIAQMANVQMLHVPYQGAAPVATDVLGGRLDFAFLNVSGVTGHIQGGRVRGLAVTTLTPSPALPDLPTMHATLPGFEVNSWYGLMGPANLAAPIVDRLYREATAALRAPDVDGFLRQNGLGPDGSSPQQYAEQLRTDIARWTDLARRAGLRRE